ncbi:hypothetical protein B0J18DRAFT_434042 [Chaetomium sp. MPI-SDFR-AT-0129]|nr:hypothetical protein B0J18DRAFT_434042 [Chaetomium sp. MPI-SDFR-AT-0129]
MCLYLFEACDRCKESTRLLSYIKPCDKEAERLKSGDLYARREHHSAFRYTFRILIKDAGGLGCIHKRRFTDQAQPQQACVPRPAIDGLAFVSFEEFSEHAHNGRLGGHMNNYDWPFTNKWTKKDDQVIKTKIFFNRVDAVREEMTQKMGANQQGNLPCVQFYYPGQNPGTDRSVLSIALGQADERQGQDGGQTPSINTAEMPNATQSHTALGGGYQACWGDHLIDPTLLGQQQQEQQFADQFQPAQGPAVGAPAASPFAAAGAPGVGGPAGVGGQPNAAGQVVVSGPPAAANNNNNNNPAAASRGGWTDEMKQMLVHLHDLGWSYQKMIDEIPMFHGRTRNALESMRYKIKKEGLLEEQ